MFSVAMCRRFMGDVPSLILLRIGFQRKTLGDLARTQHTSRSKSSTAINTAMLVFSKYGPQ